MVKKSKFTVEIDGVFKEVELEVHKETLILYTPKKIIVRLVPVKQEEGVYLGLINNRPFLFKCKTNGAITILQTSQAIYQAKVRKGTISSKGIAHTKTEITVKTPMSGVVTKVLKHDGETITKGAGIVIIEAMKMQNEVQSPSDGIVSKVFVKEGDPVKPGMNLFKVRPIPK